MYAKIEPHRARSVTYVILKNYKKKTAELKKIAIKWAIPENIHTQPRTASMF